MDCAMSRFSFAICMVVAINVNIAASYNEYDLFVLSRKMDFSNALDLCWKHDMNVVRINDEETNQMVYDFAVKRKLGPYWIDGSRGSDGVSWYDSDRKKLTYTKWQRGEPNNRGNVENCIDGLFYKNGFWNDVNCNIKISVICVAEPSQVNTQKVIRVNQLVHLPGKANYKTAVRMCKNKGMDLIGIHNEATNKVVYDYAVKQKLGQYWIDVNDIATEGLFVDSNGDRIVYNNWHSGEPNGGKSERCVHGLFYKDGSWNDVNCNIKISIICYK